MTNTATNEDQPDKSLRRILELVEQQRAIERELSAAVRQAQLAGYSWQAIAYHLGVTRQAAHKKYGKLK
ncbi:hypothetical protein EG850_07440 [Gulosibacter macacae]|uniref:AsnC family protein n=1 Tax=Gulosibacter macacae TaxID=2488791 RepID=A0A3P3VVL9_9MICO|nr:hypothetical protein [Gulosibacter macacae]RRJ86845.1 hypothetical protein EG850_07440 [Gulosibacter macacae]